MEKRYTKKYFGKDNISFAIGEEVLFGSIIDSETLNKPLSSGDTKLHRAIIRNNKKTVKFLVKNGADASLKNKHGQSAFDLANRLGRHELVKELVRKVK